MSELTEEERNAMTRTFFAGVWKLILLLFAVFVGTALVLNIVAVGPGWGNVPWLIFCLYALLRSAH